jgi:uncharacterized RDD family membrane protein YckC
MDNLVIDTPEQIPLEFPLAGIGSRFLALAVDTLIQSAAAVVLVSVAMIIGGATQKIQTRGTWVLAIVLILLFIVHFGYFAIFETVWNGQTPGKRATHLRVIQDSGRPITVYEAVARNLLRIIDSLPGLYGVAIISALLSGKSKRLGDYVAGTVVVHEKPATLETAVRWETAAPPGSLKHDVSRLAPGEFKLIEAFLLRRNQLSADVRAQTARKILERLYSRIEFTPDEFKNPEPTLESLTAAYRARSRYG